MIHALPIDVSHAVLQPNLSRCQGQGCARATCLDTIPDKRRSEHYEGVSRREWADAGEGGEGAEVAAEACVGGNSATDKNDLDEKVFKRV